jgi:predicted nucleic acid-binding protein
VKILLDTDVLLDVPLAGPQRHFPDSLALVRWCQNRAGTAQIAWHSLSNIYYLLNRQKTPAPFDVRNYIRNLLKFVAVVPTGTAQAQIALELPLPDFEDALQVSAALHAGADYIITRNLIHYRASPVRALSPGDFLSLHST